MRTTAAAAFEKVDRPLREGIERWRRALALAPAQWSGHEELAHLAEQREEFELAAERYELAWKLRPAKTELLLALERVWSALDRPQEARAALVAAWRTGPPRVAERARERLGGNPSETEMALAGTPAVAAGAKEEALCTPRRWASSLWSRATWPTRIVI